MTDPKPGLKTGLKVGQFQDWLVSRTGLKTGFKIDWSQDWSVDRYWSLNIIPSHFVDWTDENNFDISFRHLLIQIVTQLEPKIVNT